IILQLTPSTVSYTLSLHDALPILVVIVPHGSSWMDPSAHPTFRVAAYQQDITVEINPHEPTVVPANGVSRAQLWVTLNRRLNPRSEEHTSELQSRGQLVCRLLLER